MNIFSVYWRQLVYHFLFFHEIVWTILFLFHFVACFLFVIFQVEVIHLFVERFFWIVVGWACFNNEKSINGFLTAKIIEIVCHILIICCRILKTRLIHLFWAFGVALFCFYGLLFIFCAAQQNKILVSRKLLDRTCAVDSTLLEPALNIFIQLQVTVHLRVFLNILVYLRKIVLQHF